MVFRYFNYVEFGHHVITVEASTLDGAVDQNDEHELDRLNGKNAAVHSPAQLVSIEQQTAAVAVTTTAS